jgi:hypothetical protein
VLTLEDRRPRPDPLLYVVGPWEIKKSTDAGSLVKRLQWNRTLICGPGPMHHIRPWPAHSQIFRGLGVEHFYCDRMLILKIVACKRFIEKF